MKSAFLRSRNFMGETIADRKEGLITRDLLLKLVWVRGLPGKLFCAWDPTILLRTFSGMACWFYHRLQRFTRAFGSTWSEPMARRCRSEGPGIKSKSRRGFISAQLQMHLAIAILHLKDATFWLCGKSTKTPVGSFFKSNFCESNTNVRVGI